MRAPQRWPPLAGVHRFVLRAGLFSPPPLPLSMVAARPHRLHSTRIMRCERAAVGHDLFAGRAGFCV
eukprot:3422934-Pyramimonas_sp.AAC.1